MKLIVENDFQQKIMRQSFSAGDKIASAADVQEWRNQWMAALKTWHSPYKLLVDFTNLSVLENEPAIQDGLSRMIKFFEGLFLRKAAGFGLASHLSSAALPIPNFLTADEALTDLGIRQRQGQVIAGDFRASIVFQNHFQQHTIELSLSEPVIIDSIEKLNILKSKLTNNLMQWHSRWNLLVDCTNLSFTQEAIAGFEGFSKFFRNFFMKDIIGYSPSSTAEAYPFKVLRARHNAVAKLESEGMFSGGDADCKSKKA